jgi:hypothetical protein
MVFSMVYATTVYYIALDWIGSTYSASQSLLFEYGGLFWGAALVTFGYFFLRKRLQGLGSLVYVFGSLLFLGSTLSLAGFSSTTSGYVWEFLFPMLSLLVILLSIVMQTSTLLVVGSVFIIIDVIKLSEDYFSQSLGWPISLVLAGMLIIAIGWYASRINKRFIVKKLS